MLDSILSACEQALLDRECGEVKGGVRVMVTVRVKVTTMRVKVRVRVTEG